MHSQTDKSNNAAASLNYLRTNRRCQPQSAASSRSSVKNASLQNDQNYQFQPGYRRLILKNFHSSKTAQATLVTRHTLNFARFCRFVPFIIIALILFIFNCLINLPGVVHAAPQSCILCDKNDLEAKDPGGNSYEEFRFEHQVTRQDAINALKTLNNSFYHGSSCKSVSCTKSVMKYCLGAQFINDHCWCELGHTEEGLPFVPHICYVGEKVYTASLGSCFLYEDVKDCCCAPALAKQWRHISGGMKMSVHNHQWILLVLAFFFIVVTRREC